MKRQDAEKIITEYIKPVFGFTLKKCKSLHDAEDLSQEIVLKAFRAMLLKDDIADVSKFIWTIAHNTLNNYYRDSAKTVIGVPIYDVAELIADNDFALYENDTKEAEERLHREIAFLSKMQRRIVIAYYFENRKQADIARELGISLGTVKWHLFEAKKELKRGMDTMRNASELKFNPISFSICGFSGSPGAKGTARNFFHSSITQNIAYCVAKDAKTVNEIATELGVSPVYVESEAEYLEEYGFLLKKGDKYIINFLLEEINDKAFADIKDEMYEKSAKLFANELYDYEYSCMAEKGYMRRYSSEKGTWTTLQIAWIRNAEAMKLLLDFGNRIKEKYKEEFDKLKAPYIKAVLDSTPKHLRKMRMYMLQFIFYSDGWFILHCLKELVNNGKLKLPTSEQRKSLTTLIIPN